jgi:hypothetical protein
MLKNTKTVASVNQTSSSTNYFTISLDKNSLKNCSNLQKGYLFEMYTQSVLHNLGVRYEGNPTQYEVWLSHKSSPHDAKVKLRDVWFKMECKLCLKPIFRSWFERDWLSREADVYVTNNKEAIPKKCRKELRRRGKKLFNIAELVKWIQKKQIQGPKPLTNRIFEYTRHLLSSIVNISSNTIRSTEKACFSTMKIGKLLSFSEKDVKNLWRP